MPRHADAVWDDLRRLKGVMSDPGNERVRDDIENVWEVLRRWAEGHAVRVHEGQMEIHQSLEDLAELMETFRKQEHEERMACERLKSDLMEVRRVREKAQSLEQQLRHFNDRLRRL